MGIVHFKKENSNTLNNTSTSWIIVLPQQIKRRVVSWDLKILPNIAVINQSSDSTRYILFPDSRDKSYYCTEHIDLCEHSLLYNINFYIQRRKLKDN